MATGGQSSSPQPQGPVTSLKGCPHCGSLCLGPRILPCGHLLCRKCLHHKLLHRSPVCPRCEKAIHLPGDQDLTPSQLISQMSTDPVMERVVLQELEKSVDIHCFNCPPKMAANVCLDCQEYYCDVCSVNHLKSRYTQDHVLRPLPQALQNTSSTASAIPHPRSPSVLSVDTVSNVDDQQSRGVSRDKSTAVKEWEKWMKTEVGDLQQAYRYHHEMDTTLQNMETLVQQFRNMVNTHKQMLDTYQQYLSHLEVIQSADPGSYMVKTRGSDVSMDVKTASLKKRLCDVRTDHSCPDINKLKMITGQLTQLLHSAAAEEKSGSSFIHPPKSTPASPTQTSTATPQTPPTPDDTPPFTPCVDVMTATPQRVFKASPTTDEDRERPRIKAIVCLSDDRLVMVDKNNNKVKVMDVKPPHTLSASRHIPDSPRRLAVLPDGLVAMTTDKPLIYLMKIMTKVKILSKIEIGRRYYGIAGHTEGHLIVSCGQSAEGSATVDVLTREGKRIRTLTDRSLVLKSPSYLCPSGDQHILLSDFDQNMVHKIDVCSGQVTQTFHHTRMDYPLQVCTDRNGNMFVACAGDDCVMVRNRDGQWKRLLIASKHSDPGKTVPWGVCLTRSGHLVVSWAKPGAGSVVICHKFT